MDHPSTLTYTLARTCIISTFQIHQCPHHMSFRRVPRRDNMKSCSECVVMSCSACAVYQMFFRGPHLVLLDFACLTCSEGQTYSDAQTFQNTRRSTACSKEETFCDEPSFCHTGHFPVGRTTPVAHAMHTSVRSRRQHKSTS